jgi:hypothetical protein
VCPLSVCCNLPMRWFTLRSLLSWLLLVVIPLQGFAAGTAPGCHTVFPDARAGVVMRATDAGPQSAHHVHASADAHSVALHAAHLPENSAGTVPSADRSDTPVVGDHTPAQCKACSPCCVSALPSAPAPMLRPVLSGFMLFHEPLNHHRSTVPNGLERPPRSSLG